MPFCGPVGGRRDIPGFRTWGVINGIRADPGQNAFGLAGEDDLGIVKALMRMSRI